MLYLSSEFTTLSQYPNSTGYTGLVSRANDLLSYTPEVDFTLFDPQSDNDAQIEKLSNDCQYAFLLAIAYKVTNNSSYAQKSQSFINNVFTRVTGVYKNGSGVYNLFGANLLPTLIPCLIFAADLVKSYGSFNSTAFSNWLDTAISPCSAKILDVYIPNDNNINILWNMLDLSIAIYQSDTTAINDCSDYCKELIDNQIFSTDIIPPLRDFDGQSSTNIVPYAILPQEIDRSSDYSIVNNVSHYHSGYTQGLRGIHYSHVALEGFIITFRLLKNKNIDLTATSQGAKLRNAISTIATFVLNPKSSPYYHFLSTPHTNPNTNQDVSYTENDFYNINGTSYMRLAAKYYNTSQISTVLSGMNQTFNRYLFIPVLSRRWI